MFALVLEANPTHPVNKGELEYLEKRNNFCNSFDSLLKINVIIPKPRIKLMVLKVKSLILMVARLHH